MTARSAEPIARPRPVAAYFAADTTSAEAVAQYLTDGAAVIDERRKYWGRTALAIEGRGVREVPLLGRLEGDRLARLGIAP